MTKGIINIAQMPRLVCAFIVCIQQSKKDGKDKESIQSSSTPDTGYHIGKWQKNN